MGRLEALDLAAVFEAARPELEEVAEAIAAEVAAHYPTVKVVSDRGAVSVVTYGSFDHLKEWGSVNNAPEGYMRAAAARRGEFRPEGK